MIKPVMTSRQWKSGIYRRNGDYGDGARSNFHVGGDGNRGLAISHNFSSHVIYLEHPDLIAAAMARANHELPDDSPYKITRAMVDSLRIGEGHLESCPAYNILTDYEGMAETQCACDAHSNAHRVADILAALLPPTPP